MHMTSEPPVSYDRYGFRTLSTHSQHSATVTGLRVVHASLAFGWSGRMGDSNARVLLQRLSLASSLCMLPLHLVGLVEWAIPTRAYCCSGAVAARLGQAHQVGHLLPDYWHGTSRSFSVRVKSSVCRISSKLHNRTLKKSRGLCLLIRHGIPDGIRGKVHRSTPA